MIHGPTRPTRTNQRGLLMYVKLHIVRTDDTGMDLYDTAIAVYIDDNVAGALAFDWAEWLVANMVGTYRILHMECVALTPIGN